MNTPLLCGLLRELSAVIGCTVPSIQFRRLQIDGATITGDIKMVTITDSQKFSITAGGIDAKGNPTTLDGAITFTSSDPALLTVTSTGNLSADVVAVGPLGNAQVLANGDADLGAGVVPVTGILDVVIIAGQAVNIAIAAGAVSDQ